MNSQEKQGYIDEINYQKKMIHNPYKMVTQFVLPFLSGSLIDVLFFKYPICKNLCNHINNNIYISDYPCWKGYLQW